MKNPQLASFIEQMTKIDQAIRNNASGGFSEANYLVYLLDAVHESRIHRIIQANGYPTHDLIGPEAMKSFWLLIQHQDFDPALQEACLNHCDFDPKEKAHLTDRVRINSGRDQIYGTQFMRKEGKLVPQPIEDEEHVNERRLFVGLETMEVYTKKMNGG
jgi:hypothetical protein